MEPVSIDDIAKYGDFYLIIGEDRIKVSRMILINTLPALDTIARMTTENWFVFEPDTIIDVGLVRSADLMKSIIIPVIYSWREFGEFPPLDYASEDEYISTIRDLIPIVDYLISGDITYSPDPLMLFDTLRDMVIRPAAKFGTTFEQIDLDDEFANKWFVKQLFHLR
jgi:hypothetical protein